MNNANTVATHASLPARVRGDLRAAADPAKAGPMRAYMKSAMPFLGVQTPTRRRVVRAALKAAPPAGAAAWAAVVTALWEAAEYREERYAAIDVLTWPKAGIFRAPAALPLMERLIVEGAWWDLVDPVATGGVGDVLRRHRRPTTRAIRAWIAQDNLWLRRAAIICQVGHKGETDLALLYAAIRANWDDRDFFIRKAVGWALRSHAWHDPAEVKRFVHAHADHLSPLSRREALKHVLA